LNHTLLVVDDDGVLVRAMRGLLERFGYEVIEAGDVPEALAAIEIRRPDLLVMDLVLPTMDGRDGAKLIRARCPGLPVLFISGYSTEEWFRMGNPGEAFLRKPFSVEELLGAVERVLEGREWDEASQA
jgi:two-component system cell cycle sensor histidine kinase/response regulator CckA